MKTRGLPFESRMCGAVGAVRSVVEAGMRGLGGRRGRLASVSVLALALVFGTADRASAVECSTIPACKAASAYWSDYVEESVHKLLRDLPQDEDLEDMIVGHLDNIAGSVYPLSANQGTNNTQHESNLGIVTADRTTAQTAASKLASLRSKLAVEFLPARTVCQTGARSRFSNENMVFRRTGEGSTSLSVTKYPTSQLDARDLSLSKTGSDTEKGTLYAADKLVEKMSKFCDPDVFNPPSGFDCTLSAGSGKKFLHLRPGDALFNVTTIDSSDADAVEAARLYGRLVTEPLPPDPLRGKALNRVAGQSASIERLSDVAAMSLAQGAFDHMVDERVGTPISGDYYANSSAATDASYMELIHQEWGNTSHKTDSVQNRATNYTSANYDELPLVAGEVNKMYWIIFNNLERVAALKAVHLARVVRANNVGQGSLANRVTK